MGIYLCEKAFLRQKACFTANDLIQGKKSTKIKKIDKSIYFSEKYDPMMEDEEPMDEEDDEEEGLPALEELPIISPLALEYSQETDVKKETKPVPDEDVVESYTVIFFVDVNFMFFTLK